MQKPLSPQISSPAQPSYGIDAPNFKKVALLCGGALFAAGSLVKRWKKIGRPTSAIAALLQIVGVGGVLLGSTLIAYGLWGKFAIRDIRRMGFACNALFPARCMSTARTGNHSARNQPRYSPRVVMLLSSSQPQHPLQFQQIVCLLQTCLSPTVSYLR